MASRGKEQRRKGDGANHGYLMALVLALLALLSAPAQSTASELKDQTLAAWDGYISSACVRAEIRAKESPFLRISELPETRRRVQAGDRTAQRGAGRIAERLVLILRGGLRFSHRDPP